MFPWPGSVGRKTLKSILKADKHITESLLENDTLSYKDAFEMETVGDTWQPSTENPPSPSSLSHYPMATLKNPYRTKSDNTLYPPITSHKLHSNKPKNKTKSVTYSDSPVELEIRRVVSKSDEMAIEGDGSETTNYNEEYY